MASKTPLTDGSPRKLLELPIGARRRRAPDYSHAQYQCISMSDL
ncbi:MAG TPA: hypothetical protein VLZ50_10350 [Terracidiphilus sp.]|nr:hypothetical protein [Terracidiphilus sp.]